MHIVNIILCLQYYKRNEGAFWRIYGRICKGKENAYEEEMCIHLVASFHLLYPD